MSHIQNGISHNRSSVLDSCCVVVSKVTSFFNSLNVNIIRYCYKIDSFSFYYEETRCAKKKNREKEDLTLSVAQIATAAVLYLTNMCSIIHNTRILRTQSHKPHVNTCLENMVYCYLAF